MCRTPSCALCVPRTCTSDTAAYPSTCRALACVHWPAATWHQPCLRTQARRLCALSSPPPSDTAAHSEHVPHAFVCAVRSPHLYVRHRCLSEHVPRARVCPLAGGPCDINDWPVATCQISPPPTLKVSPLLRTDVRGVATRSPGARLRKGGSRKSRYPTPGYPGDPPPLYRRYNRALSRRVHTLGGFKRGNPIPTHPREHLPYHPRKYTTQCVLTLHISRASNAA